MADVLTTTSSNASSLIASALDLKVRYYLMQTPQFRQHVDVRPINQDHDGSTVTLKIHGELAAASTPLTEGVDVDARDIPALRSVSVTMNEYGATNLATIKVLTFDWSNELARTIAFQLSDNIATTMDVLVRAVLDGASNVWYNDTGVGYTATAPADGGLDVLDATGISSAVAALRSRRAIARDGVFYTCIMHPHVAHDVRRQAGANTWASPHEYVNNGPIWAGETGAYAGARIVEHNRASILTGQGSGTDKTHYLTYFLGREALLEANAIEPHSVIGPQVDKLRRFFPVGWHGILGWSRFRENAIQIVKTSSSLGTLVDLSGYDPKA